MRGKLISFLVINHSGYVSCGMCNDINTYLPFETLLRRAYQSRFIPPPKKNTFESPTLKLLSLKYDWLLYIVHCACNISAIYERPTSDEQTDTNRLGRDPTLRAIQFNCTKVLQIRFTISFVGNLIYISLFPYDFPFYLRFLY